MATVDYLQWKYALFFNHHNFASLIDRFEILCHPSIASLYTLEEIFSKKIKCDVLVLEGSFKKYGKEVYDVALRYAKSAKHIITAGSCATLGGMFRQFDRAHISGFCFKEDVANENFVSFKKELISLPSCPAHPEWIGFALLMILDNKPIAVVT